jgi:phage tail-like protein
VSGNGQGSDEQYKTFMGAGFGTLMIQYSGGRRETPETVSARGYLRNGLPALYQESDFGMRFVGALESVLDPIVAVLDALPHHFNPDLAPRDVLDLLASWLGVDLDEAQSIAARREIIRNAADLARRRGTRGGIQRALDLAFPHIPLRVEDEGGVVWTTDVTQQVEAPQPRFVVYCDKPIPEDQQAAVARCIEQVKPVHTTYRLRVKAAKKKSETQ